MATATVDPETENTEEVELPDYTDEQLKDIKLTQVQQNTINDLKKVMKAKQVAELERDFLKANLYKREHGERKAREASTEFTKTHALVYSAIVLHNKPVGEVATEYQVEVIAIANILREVRSKLFIVLLNEGQINKDVVVDLLKKHATANPRKKRDKKVAGENGSVDSDSNDDSTDSDDDDDDNPDENAGTEPSFTAEELAALEAED